MKFLTDKKYSELKAKIFDNGVICGRNDTVYTVVNSMMNSFDGSDHVFGTVILEIIADLTSGGYITLSRGAEITRELSMKENILPKKKSKKSKSKR